MHKRDSHLTAWTQLLDPSSAQSMSSRNSMKLGPKFRFMYESSFLQETKHLQTTCARGKGWWL